MRYALAGLVLIGFLVVAGNVGVDPVEAPVSFDGAQDREEESGTIFEEQKVVLDEPSFSISSDRLEQGDTLVVRLDNITPTTGFEGNLAGEPLSFFPLAEDGKWMAIVGFNTKEKTGTRLLSVNIDGEISTTSVQVVKRDFPVTVIEITPKLAKEGYSAETVTSSLVNNEGPRVRDAVSGFTRPAYFDDAFIYPIANDPEIVGVFGNIRQEGFSAFQHLGTDLDASIGTEIYAINDGVVVLNDTFPTYGNTLIIDHGLGIYSLYLHLSEARAPVGARVEKGEVVALSGNSGYSIDPHLHFSIKVNGASVDPLRFIETIEKEVTLILE